MAFTKLAVLAVLALHSVSVLALGPALSATVAFPRNTGSDGSSILMRKGDPVGVTISLTNNGRAAVFVSEVTGQINFSNELSDITTRGVAYEISPGETIVLRHAFEEHIEIPDDFDGFPADIQIILTANTDMNGQEAAVEVYKTSAILYEANTYASSDNNVNFSGSDSDSDSD